MSPLFRALLSSGFVLWLALSAAAHGEQTQFNKDEGGRKTEFKVGWRDGDHKAHKVNFSLPTDEVEADLKKTTGFPKKRANNAVEEAIRDYARSLNDGVVLKVSEDGEGGLSLRATGPNKKVIQRALAGAQEVQREALNRFVEKNDFFWLSPTLLSYDHARLVVEYTDAVRPLAEALREGVNGERRYVERVLSFIQSIPYETAKRNGDDPGYRRPLALLSRNRADCDSKVVLFLALLRAELPKLPAAVVYLPGHAFAGVGISPAKGDATFQATKKSGKGETFVVVEPVGPSLYPIGKGPAKNLRKIGKAGSAVRVVPKDR